MYAEKCFLEGHIEIEFYTGSGKCLNLAIGAGTGLLNVRAYVIVCIDDKTFQRYSVLTFLGNRLGGDGLIIGESLVSGEFDSCRQSAAAGNLRVNLADNYSRCGRSVNCQYGSRYGIGSE